MVYLQGESGALSRILGRGWDSRAADEKQGWGHTRGRVECKSALCGPWKPSRVRRKGRGSQTYRACSLTLATDRRQSPGTVQLRYRVGGKKRMCWTGNMSRQDINVDSRRWPGLHETEQP